MSKGRPFVFVWKEAVRRSRELSWKAKLVLTMLMDYAAPDGSSCFPSIARLAMDCSVSPNTVRKGLREADELGFISIQERRRGKESSSNLYRLKLPNHPPSRREVPPSRREVPPPSQREVPPSRREADQHQDQNQKETPRPTSSRRRGAKPSKQAQQLLVLWGQLLGAHKLNAKVLVGATYEEISTAMAWTLWRHRSTTGTPQRLENIPGYFAVVLASCKRGEKRLRAYSSQEIQAIAFQDVTPAMFFA